MHAVAVKSISASDAFRLRIFPRTRATLVDSCFDDSSEVAIGPGRGLLSVVKEDGFGGLLDVLEEAFWVTP